MKKIILLIVFMLMTLCGVANATDYCASAVGCWLFKEGSGTTVEDSSPNTNTGNFKGSGEPAWSTVSGTNAPSYAGGSALFDGTDDRIVVTDNNAFTITTTNELSITSWAQPTTSFPASKNAIIAKGNYPNYEWQMNYEQTSHYASAYIYRNDGVNITTFEGDTTIAGVIDTWQHLAITINNGATKSLKLYVNARSTFEKTGWSGTISNGTANVWFGGRADNANFFRGNISETAIFSSILTSTDISAIYDYGLQPSAVASATVILGNAVLNNARLLQ